jgi:hypothetical protein
MVSVSENLFIIIDMPDRFDFNKYDSNGRVIIKPKYKKLFELEIHEGYKTEFGIFIMRVPGGWIYDCWNFDTDSFKQGTYVPYSKI